MSDHLPECFASLCECDDTHFKSIDCDFYCICPSLRACEQRVLAEREADGPWFRSVVHDCCVDKQTAYAAGLDAAREAVEAIPADYKIRGEFETYSPYAEGRSDFKDGALAAIDALRGERK